MSRPNVDQLDRDWLDDHNLVDHEPAGDAPEEIRTTLVNPALPAPARAARNITNPLEGEVHR